jgi:hypothetical protein
VADDGTARLVWTFRPAVALSEGGATPESVALENKINGALGVVTCVSHRSTAGALLDVSVSTESKADLKGIHLVQSFEEVVRDLALPLPEIPVGVGAKWEVTQIRAAFGMRYQQTYRYELVELAGDRLRVRYDFSQDAPQQSLNMKDMPEEAKGALLSLQAKGEGEYVVDLGLAVPLSYTAKGSLSYQAEAEGKPDSPMRFERTFDTVLRER